MLIAVTVEINEPGAIHGTQVVIADTAPSVYLVDKARLVNGEP
jgi:hypothetical protein